MRYRLVADVAGPPWVPMPDWKGSGRLPPFGATYLGGKISAVSAPLGDRLHADHAPVDLPYLNDPVFEPLFCLLDCRSIVRAIDNRWRSGHVIVRS